MPLRTGSALGTLSWWLPGRTDISEFPTWQHKGTSAYRSLLRTFSGFPWLFKPSLNISACPLKLFILLSLPGDLILVFLSSPTWTCHCSKNGLYIEITFLSMSYGPLRPPLPGKHTPHSSSHLSSIEIPPNAIKQYISLYLLVPHRSMQPRPPFNPKHYPLPWHTCSWLALLKGCLYLFVFVLSS